MLAVVYFWKHRLGCVSFAGQGTLLTLSLKRFLPRRILLTSSRLQPPCNLRVWHQPEARKNLWLCFAWTLQAACVLPVRSVPFSLIAFSLSLLSLWSLALAFSLTHLHFLLLLFSPLSLLFLHSCLSLPLSLFPHTHQVPGHHSLRGAKEKRERTLGSLPTNLDIDFRRRDTQYLPGQRRDTTWVSRMEVSYCCQSV